MVMTTVVQTSSGVQLLLPQELHVDIQYRFLGLRYAQDIHRRFRIKSRVISTTGAAGEPVTHISICTPHSTLPVPERPGSFLSFLSEPPGTGSTLITDSALRCVHIQTQIYTPRRNHNEHNSATNPNHHLHRRQ